MRILAVADVHCPRYLTEFAAALRGCRKPDIFLMAGDMVNRGMSAEFPRVLDTIEQQIGDDVPIVACFGNEEYIDTRTKLRASTGDRVTFLDEQSTVLEIGKTTVGIVGTQGSLDKPTLWQKRNMPQPRIIFERRAERAVSLLRELRGVVDRRILLMHYSPCLETCEGEESKTFSWLGSRKFYSAVRNEQPDLVIHGHVHNATVHEARVGTTLVLNVAFPATERVTSLDLWNTDTSSVDVEEEVEEVVYSEKV
ncbi:MAG: metallophosphoesterase [Candidatus Thorarchaeota archaeon]|nr:metallophosphoesterase [Candidatus Thorarchaeota archaeon]